MSQANARILTWTRLVVALAALAAPLGAAADPQADAQVQIDLAMKAHQDGRFEDARRALEAAYGLDPQPQLIYALGQVHVKLGRCEDAIRFYEQFLATNPARSAADGANQAIVACRVAIAQASENEPHSPDAEIPGALPSPGPGPELPRGQTPWFRDKLGLTLVGSGAVSSIVGLVLYSGARGKLDDAEAATSYAASEALLDDARAQRRLAVVFGVIGGGLIAGGVVYYVRRGRAEQRTSVGVVPTTSGGVIQLSGRF